MSKTGGQETFQLANQQQEPKTTTNNKQRAKQFSSALQNRMKNNPLTKEEELERLIQKQIELQTITCNEQKRKLKKFLDLSKQLQKPKDEKKIKELLGILQTSNKPLPSNVVGELKLLEIMGSPYSQPLMGMIREIEAQINRKFGDDKPRHRKNRRHDSEVPVKTEELVIIRSSRQLEQALQAYNNEDQILVHKHASGTASYQSKESSAEGSMSSRKQNNGRGSAHFKPPRHQSQKTREAQDSNGFLKQSSPRSNKFQAEDVRKWQQSNSGRRSKRESVSSSLKSGRSSRFPGDGSNSSQEKPPKSSKRKRKVVSINKQKDSLSNSGKQSLKRSRNSSNGSLGRGGAATAVNREQSSENLMTTVEDGFSTMMGGRRKSSYRKNQSNKPLSHYSSINQVLIEHEMEESIISIRQQDQSSQGEKQQSK